MRATLGLLGLVIALGTSGCVVAPPYPPAGVSVGVYGEYPYYSHGYGYYHGGHYYRWHHPYDRDRYFYRSYHY